MKIFRCEGEGGRNRRCWVCDQNALGAAGSLDSMRILCKYISYPRFLPANVHWPGAAFSAAL